MNILFFLTPKAMCSYVDADSTLRQAMERMENSGYTALPILDAEGHYKGVITEGDLLWAFKRLCVMDIRQTEEDVYKRQAAWRPRACSTAFTPSILPAAPPDSACRLQNS